MVAVKVELEHDRCPHGWLSKITDRKRLSIAKNHPKPSQEFSERFGPSIHKMKGFGGNSRQKVHPNFAHILGRPILGNTFCGLNKRLQAICLNREVSLWSRKSGIMQVEKHENEAYSNGVVTKTIEDV